MSILKEMLDLVPYQYKCISESIIEFYNDNGIRFGVVLDQQELDLTKLTPNKNLDIINVAFGVVKDGDIISNTTIDRALTGAGEPRKIFSTVGDIITKSKICQDADCIIAGASDSVKDKRGKLYIIVYSEIRSRLPQFKHADSLTTLNGTILLVARSCELSDIEKQYVLDNLQLDKR